MSDINLDYENMLYLSICDLKSVQCALSSDDSMDCEAMYGLWRTVSNTTDRLQSIRDNMGASPSP